jgi:hypothetical protein
MQLPLKSFDLTLCQRFWQVRGDLIDGFKQSVESYPRMMFGTFQQTCGHVIA